MHDLNSTVLTLLLWSLVSSWTVEGLYCKRPIQCLASSKILTPHPLTAWRVCTVFGAGGGHTPWVDRGRGWLNILEDPRHSSVLYIRKYFVSWTRGWNILKDKSWRVRGAPTLPTVHSSLLKKTKMLYKRRSCLSVSYCTLECRVK